MRQHGFESRWGRHSYQIMILIPAVLFLISALGAAGTTLSGQLADGVTGTFLGGADAFVVAYLELPNETNDVVILGYAHPDDEGKWRIPGLPGAGKIYLAGFHRKHATRFLHAEVTLTGEPAIDIGVQRLQPRPVGKGMDGLSSVPKLPHLVMNRQNQEIADELMRLILVKGKSLVSAPLASMGMERSIDGLWTRSGRVYRISGSVATIVDVGAALKTTAAAGDEVMRDIRRTGDDTWSAEILWQREAEKKWATGILTLSADGITLTRVCPSPWNGVDETVIFTRK